MDTQHFFGGGGGTSVHAIALIVVIIASILIALLPRQYVFMPLLFATALVPMTEQVLIAGVHLTMSRLLILLALIRRSTLDKPKDTDGIVRWTRIDKVFCVYCLCSVVTYVILWDGESGAIVYRLGFLYNACGMYFAVRALLRTGEDVHRASGIIACLFILIAAGMINQRISGSNLFSILGGVPESSDVRNGKIRAQGPFVHPLTAGAIGAAILPLAVGLWWADKKFAKHKWLAMAGTVSAAAVGITSNSSTALLTLAASVLGLCLWPLRRYLFAIRWAVVLILLVLHMVMKAPVWALIARIDLTGSSSGFHRYTLVDQFIRRFPEWWLVGTQTTANWGWDMWDTINSYVNAGTGGGLITFLLFIALLSVSFQELGRTRTAQPERARQCWVLGAMLFAQAVAFFGIEYFDQTQFVWYSSLAMISSAVAYRPIAKRDSQLESEVPELAASPWFT
jgi:hypothetical protein